MKRLCVCLAAAAAAAFGLNLSAQPPEGDGGDAPPRAEGRDGDRPDGDRDGGREGGRDGGREGRRGGRFGGGFGGPGGFRMPPHPVVAALDANGDGELSEEEINGAVAALKKLDKNNDGKLAADEIRPQFGGPGGGFGDPGQFIDRMIENADADKDGKLSKDEMPEFMRSDERFAEIDTNKDGFADKAELEENTRRMRERFGRGPGGPGGPGGDRPRERPPTRERDQPAESTPDAPDVSADDL